MSIYRIVTLCALVALIFISLPNETCGEPLTVTFGLGCGLKSFEEGGIPPAIGFVANKSLHSYAFCARFMYASEVHISLGLPGGSGPTERYFDFGILAGLRTRPSEYGTEGSLQVGIAYTGITQEVRLFDPIEHYQVGTEKAEANTIGLALQGQFYARRLGVILAGNVNKEMSFGIFLVGFRIGSLK